MSESQRPEGAMVMVPREQVGHLIALVALHDKFIRAQGGLCGNQADAYNLIATRYDEWAKARYAAEKITLAMIAAAQQSPEAAGCAETEVGRAVYERIEALIGAEPGTPDGRELALLSYMAESVEEVGGYDGPRDDPFSAEAILARLASDLRTRGIDPDKTNDPAVAAILALDHHRTQQSPISGEGAKPTGEQMVCGSDWQRRMLDTPPVPSVSGQGSSLRDTQPGSADKWADLERLARAATEGPWMRDRLEPETIRTEAEGDIIIGEVEHIKDAAFIEAANPAAVLDLIGRARSSRAALIPFAALAEEFSVCGDGQPIGVKAASGKSDLNVGHLRLAAEAVK